MIDLTSATFVAGGVAGLRVGVLVTRWWVTARTQSRAQAQLFESEERAQRADALAVVLQQRLEQEQSEVGQLRLALAESQEGRTKAETRMEVISRTILQNVVVMNLGYFQLQAPVAVDPAATPVAGQQQETSPAIITLMVTPQDSIALNYFVYSGAVMSMTLRNPNDNSRIKAQSATLTSLLTQYNISLPSKLPYAFQTRLDFLAPPSLPNDIINTQPSNKIIYFEVSALCLLMKKSVC